jgi:hypothetical protein
MRRASPLRTVDELVRLAPQVEIARLVERVPDPAAFVYEPKVDGYRILAVKAGGEVRLVSRRGNDWSVELAPIARAVAALDTDDALVDGAACAPDARGVPSFRRLQSRPPGARLEVARGVAGGLNGEGPVARGVVGGLGGEGAVARGVAGGLGGDRAAGGGRRVQRGSGSRA